jgi:hypothetical protein
MAEIEINKSWDKLKIKVKRKYRDLSDEDLAYTAGQEEDLINRLMKAIHKDRTYVVFMLKKMLLNMENNRL